MNSIFKTKYCVLVLVLAHYASAKTSCEQSQKHFASLCFSPTPTMDADFEWSQKNQPEDGWHLEIGNDVARLHTAEVLRGEHLSADDKSLENSCLRLKITPGVVNDQHVADGQVLGFGNLKSKWDCNASMDFPGVLNCDVSSTLSKYHEYLHVYVNYSDNKNIQIAIICFPNGTVGWMALSISKSLSEEETKAVTDHVTSLGFNNDDTVVMYDEAGCANDTN